jgi:hypothetical protein
MLVTHVVMLRTLGLLCSGHRAVATRERMKEFQTCEPDQFLDPGPAGMYRRRVRGET